MAAGTTLAVAATFAAVLGAVAATLPVLPDVCATAGGVTEGQACSLGLLQHDAASRRSSSKARDEPSTMRAIRRSPVGGLSVETAKVPVPSAGEVLVQVAYSSVNPIDWKLPLPGPAGRDFSGTVLAAGERCDLPVGGKVFGDAPAGAWAEVLAIPCDGAALAPVEWTLAQAGAAPHAALTALQALTSAGAPWSIGDAPAPTVVVLGGAGGVGHLAVQLAKALGAGQVITTTSTSNFEHLKALGADQTIDYHEADWWTVLGADSCDLVLDTVGDAGTGDRAYETLRSGGKFVTTLGGRAMATESKASVSQSFCKVSDTSSQYLETLRAFAEDGKLTVDIASTYDLSGLSQAVAESKKGHVHGKISIKVV